MGTRANIIRKNENETFDVIYTHWDGYPSHHGPILLGHYNSPAQVQALLMVGDLSSLGENVGEKHDFNQCPDDVCNAYGRDRGEKGAKVKHIKSPDELKAFLDGSWTEWIYMWDVATSTWFYTNNPSPTWFKCCGKDQLPLYRLDQWEQNEAREEASK